MKRLSLLAVIVAVICAVLFSPFLTISASAFPPWEPVFKADCSTNTKLNSVCVNTTNQTVCVGTGAACQATSGGVQGPAGAAGTNGAKWYVGAGAPVGGTGIDGDFYLRTSNGDVYGPKTGGAWGAVTGNLMGATGSQGPQGIQGDPGPQGDQGIQGIQGLQGEQGIQGIPGAGSTITVQEQDGAPTGSASTLKFPNASVTDDGGGAFSVTFSASDTIGWDYTALAAEPGTPIVGKVYRANNEAAGWRPDSSLSGSTTDYFTFRTASGAWKSLITLEGDWAIRAIPLIEWLTSTLTDTTSPHDLVAAELKGTVLTNSGAGASTTYNFPARTVGWNFIVQVEAAQNIVLNPNGTEQWYLNGTQMAAGENIQNAAPTVGESITCFSTTAAVYCESKYTDWAQETP
jgi:hypothetical protein